MRLIADGVVDRDGVPGLARRLGYSSRQLGRILNDELGAGPLALARAQRAQTARTLLENTDLRAADVAFAAGFTSVRQFNDTLREVYDANPTALRSRRGHRPRPGTLRLRIAVRTPFAGATLLPSSLAVIGELFTDPRRRAQAIGKRTRDEWLALVGSDGARRNGWAHSRPVPCLDDDFHSRDRRSSLEHSAVVRNQCRVTRLPHGN
jgi:AraC-like DNA-binding protein